MTLSSSSLYNANKNSYVLYRMVLFPVTLAFHSNYMSLSCAISEI